MQVFQVATSVNNIVSTVFDIKSALGLSDQVRTLLAYDELISSSRLLSLSSKALEFPARLEAMKFMFTAWDLANLPTKIQNTFPESVFTLLQWLNGSFSIYGGGGRAGGYYPPSQGK